jgi:two-component system copper resistance phosphate regulon response regulator CusR
LSCSGELPVIFTAEACTPVICQCGHNEGVVRALRRASSSAQRFGWRRAVPFTSNGGACVKILVVEDEPKAAEYLRQGLVESGYTVEVATNGTDGLHAAVNGDHDLVILDVMLPGIDGFAVLSALRTSRQVPVLMLTARDRVDDKVRGFDLGADDYLVKPFQFPELLARVRTLLKRNQAVPADPVVRVADLEIDAVRHRATRSGRRIDLSAKEFALLSLLAQKAGQVLSRTQIASLVWDIHFDSDTNVVEVAVRRLRAKIDDPFDEKLIHTVRGVGYVLERRS